MTRSPRVVDISIREQLLADGIDLTGGDRNATYGDPQINLDCMAELLTVLGKHRVVNRGGAHNAAIAYVCGKLARIATSPELEPHRDSYLDAAVYFAIAYECAVREIDKAKSQSAD